MMRDCNLIRKGKYHLFHWFKKRQDFSLSTHNIYFFVIYLLQKVEEAVDAAKCRGKTRAFTLMSTPSFKYLFRT